MPTLNHNIDNVQRIVSGVQRLVILPKRKRAPQKGCTLYHYTRRWSKTPCYLGKSECVKVQRITAQICKNLFSEPYLSVSLQGCLLIGDTLENLIYQIGLGSRDEFQQKYLTGDEQFNGLVLHWSTIKLATKKEQKTGRKK